MKTDAALQILYSRENRSVVTTVCSDLPEFSPGKRTVRWQQNHKDKHTQREILLMLSGSSVLHLSGKYYKVTPGSMFFFNRQEVHSYGFPPGSSGLACWLVILPKDLHVNFVDTTGKPFKYLSKQFIRRTPAVDILEKAWDRFTVPALNEEEKQASLTEMSSCANLLFAEIWRHVRRLPDPVFPKRSLNAADAVKRAQKYLQDHCGATVQDLANIAGYSPSHFVRLFKQYAKLGVKEYINLIRKEKMRKYKNTLPAKQLAEILGFSSSSAYFHWRDNTNKRFTRQLVSRPGITGK